MTGRKEDRRWKERPCILFLHISYFALHLAMTPDTKCKPKAIDQPIRSLCLSLLRRMDHLGVLFGMYVIISHVVESSMIYATFVIQTSHTDRYLCICRVIFRFSPFLRPQSWSKAVRQKKIQMQRDRETFEVQLRICPHRAFVSFVRPYVRSARKWPWAAVMVYIPWTNMHSGTWMGGRG